MNLHRYFESDSVLSKVKASPHQSAMNPSGFAHPRHHRHPSFSCCSFGECDPTVSATGTQCCQMTELYCIGHCSSPSMCHASGLRYYTLPVKQPDPFHPLTHARPGFQLLFKGLRDRLALPPFSLRYLPQQPCGWKGCVWAP